jgi:exopolysaccharide biosynthesis polyprenyl glycosylphosphotransferase
MDKKSLQTLLKVILAAGDAAGITIALLCAFYTRFFLQLIPLRHAVPPLMPYIYATPFVVLVLMLAYNYAGLYSIKAAHSRFDELTRVIVSVSATVIVFMSVTFFLRRFSFSRIVLLYVWGFGTAISCLWRLAYRAIYNLMRKKEYIVHRILIAGATEVSMILIERIKRHPELGYHIVGCVDDKIKKGRKTGDVTVLGRIKDLNRIITDSKADEVFVGLANYNRREIADTILKNEKVKFMIASDVLGIITKNIEYGELHGIPVFAVKELPLNKMENRFIKRTLDIVISFTALVILSPVFAVAALLVKISSPGPVFYKQERIGRNNSVFNVLKFRSMRIDAEKKSGPVWADENDPRRTAVGTMLRKTSIDELPQLINILRGEMSLVGPRPERPHFVNKFKQEIPRYMERHKVKAGLTGWAAVNGLRGNTSLEERIKFDLYYIENWSIWFDIKIIIKTALEIFNHTTAY